MPKIGERRKGQPLTAPAPSPAPKAAPRPEAEFTKCKPLAPQRLPGGKTLVRVYKADVEAFVDVPAEVAFTHFALHLPFGGKATHLAVTHIPTGLGVGAFDSKEEAKEFTRLTALLGDWSGLRSDALGRIAYRDSAARQLVWLGAHVRGLCARGQWKDAEAFVKANAMPVPASQEKLPARPGGGLFS